MHRLLQLDPAIVWIAIDIILLSNAHALQRALSYYLRFCVYVWTGENDSNTLRTCGREFFSKTEKKTSVLKNIPIRVDRALDVDISCVFAADSQQRIRIYRETL